MLGNFLDFHDKQRFNITDVADKAEGYVLWLRLKKRTTLASRPIKASTKGGRMQALTHTRYSSESNFRVSSFNLACPRSR